jgi:protein arginine N-methyltransferase 1
MNLSKNTLLQVIPNITIKLEARDRINIEYKGAIITGTSQTLSIIHTFYNQKTIDEGLKELGKSCKSDQQWMDTSNEVINLHNLGVLKSPDQHEKIIHTHSSQYSSAAVHIRMLNDRTRTLNYQKAIREVIGPNDIVVDIGTGTGILAITAAQAGAKHVYAIERSIMGKITQQTFDKNGLGNRITLIEGDSRTIELPEKATVMVSELLGNDPLGETILPITIDAVKRLLHPNAKLIPYQVNLYALPVTIPSNRISSLLFTQEAITNWKEWYDIDFSSVLAPNKHNNLSIIINMYKMREFQHLSDPKFITKVNLSELTSSVLDENFKLDINKDGLLNGVLVYFIAQLSELTQLSIAPHHVDESNHWAGYIWVPSTARQVKKGEKIEMKYKFDIESSFSFMS